MEILSKEFWGWGGRIVILICSGDDAVCWPLGELSGDVVQCHSHSIYD